MPYIAQDLRLDAEKGPRSAGELNYAITRLVCAYLKQKNRTIRYDDYNEVIGVLTATQLEFYRRLVTDYEDKKKKENGEVYII